MKKLLVVLCAMFLVFWMNGSLEARIIDFEDLYQNSDPTVLPMPEGYAGFNWSSSFLSNDKWYADGYVYGTIGNTSSITTQSGASMYKDNGDYFDFYGAYISDVYWGGAVTVEGWRDGTRIYSVAKVITIPHYANPQPLPDYYTFNYVMVDKLRWYSPEGHICIDNISVGNEIAGVPIPGAVWLLGSGLIGIVGIRRKMKQ